MLGLTLGFSLCSLWRQSFHPSYKVNNVYQPE